MTGEGNIITDSILARAAEHEYILSGIPAAQNWVKYHGEKGGYDVAFTTDPSTAFRGGRDPVLFRYQIQGPGGRELVEAVFDGPLPPSKFSHSIPVTLDGRDFQALRHNMAGQDGYEFIGPWEHAAFVKDALLSVGAKFGIVHVGALAYASASVESGWVPSPVPATSASPPDGNPGHRRHDPGAYAHQQGARHSRHPGHGDLGRTPRCGDRQGRRPRLPEDPRHGRPPRRTTRTQRRNTGATNGHTIVLWCEPRDAPWD